MHRRQGSIWGFGAADSTDASRRRPRDPEAWTPDPLFPPGQAFGGCRRGTSARGSVELLDPDTHLNHLHQES